MAGAPKIVNLSMRALQFVWVLLIMSLIGNMIAETNGGSSAIVNYYMFTAAFAMLSLLYLFPATIWESASGHPFILYAVDALNVVFTFCGAVALPAYLHVHSCNNQYYTHSNSILRNAKDGAFTKRCREAQASTAFMWFAWASFMASLVLDFLQSRSAGTSSSSRGGMRRPQMSQA